jgi:hypothetical protein
MKTAVNIGPIHLVAGLAALIGAVTCRVARYFAVDLTAAELVARFCAKSLVCRVARWYS